MALHSETIRAILNNWDAPKYDGSQDVQRWLIEIEGKCLLYGIPGIQMTEMAVKCTEGEVNTDLTAILEARDAEGGVWSWADFKEYMVQIGDDYRPNTRDAPQNAEGGGFRSEHPNVTPTLRGALVQLGTMLVFSAIQNIILGAIGFCLGGVIPGIFAAFLRPATHRVATRGVFSFFRSLATKIVVSLLATLAGSVLTAVWAWLRPGRRNRGGPAAVGS